VAEAAGTALLPVRGLGMARSGVTAASAPIFELEIGRAGPSPPDLTISIRIYSKIGLVVDSGLGRCALKHRQM